MLPESELIRLLKSSESNWVERKPPGVSSEEIRNTLVAFANSVAKKQHGVLFIGVSDDGKLKGVENADQKQKDVAKIAEQRCYPPVKCEPTAFRVDGVELIAVVVEASNNRPHFSGHAYIRVGSETKKASAEKFEELIASRNDKVRHLLREKDKVITVFWSGQESRVFFENLRLPILDIRNGVEGECKIAACDSQFVQFNIITAKGDLPNDKWNVSRMALAPIDKVTLAFDNLNRRVKLIINF